MNNQHDIGYKKLFSNPDMIKGLLTHFVDEDFVTKLDYSTLERLDKSFITDEFKEKESDMIYRVNYEGSEIYIFLLIEFQSTVDRYMSLRMLRYILEFYEYFIKARKDQFDRKQKEKLPAVFPLLLYNGDENWTAKIDISELIESYGIGESFIPKFKYYPIIENKIEKAKLVGIKSAVSALFYMENSNPQEITENIDTIFGLFGDEREEVKQVVKIWMLKVLNLDDKDIDEIKEKFDSMEGKQMLAQAVKIHESSLIEQGMQQGMQQGYLKNNQDNAIKMYENGIDIKVIESVTGLSQVEIQKLIDENVN